MNKFYVIMHFKERDLMGITVTTHTNLTNTGKGILDEGSKKYEDIVQEVREGHKFEPWREDHYE